MSLRVATAVLMATAVISGPALACKGPTVIFADNFQTADPSWHGTLAISGGTANVTANPEQFGGAFYGGKIIDSGDACVDIAGPTLSDPTQAVAGIMFGFTDLYNFYSFLILENGEAAVIHRQNAGLLTPVAAHAAPALKTGANVTNTLRVTWQGTSASAYINDEPFATFSIQALQNTMIGLYVENDTDGSVPVTYQFSNLNVTNVP